MTIDVFSAPPLTEAAVERFAARLRGPLIQPGDPTYDQARAVYNGMIDRSPRAIAVCANVADVIAAVQFGREHDLIISIRGGGHNVTGFAVNDGGLVIDLSAMRGIRIDPAAKTARVEGGATWGGLDHAAHPFGLATPSGVISTTGVAGLTLGGGFGHLSRRYGLACDNLRSVDLVTADGTFLTASADQHADLFWAVRGGGGNFGVVTSFEFALHPVDVVFGGPIFYPVEESGTVLHFYRDFIAQAPPDLSAFFGYHIAPAAPFVPEHLHGAVACAIVVCYTGPIERAEHVVEPLRKVAPVALDLMGALPYPALNSLFDALLPPGLHHYWKADFVESLTDEAIEVHTEHGPRVPNAQSLMHLYPLDGAIQRVAPDATAFSHRDVSFAHIIAGIDADPAAMPAHTAWVRSYWSALHPHSTRGAYVNFLMDEGQDRVKATYRDNYPRLADLKARYDPDNLFRMNQNIRPRL
jgi:FAD/FMN-containing dehydrogenase